MLGEKHEYELVREIGSGSYGKIYESTLKDTGLRVAVKRMMYECKEGVCASAMREVTALRLLKHPNIVGMIGIRFYEESTDLVLELVSSDVKRYTANCRHLKNTGLLDRGIYFERAMRIMSELAAALAFCHANDIMHRDVSAANVLLTEDCHVRLADFGASCTLDRTHLWYTGEYMTLYYRAPELLLGETKFDEAIDTWGLGAVCMQIMLMKPHLRGVSWDSQLYLTLVYAGSPHAPHVDWPRGAQLLDDIVQRGEHIIPPHQLCRKPGAGLTTSWTAFIPVMQFVDKHLLALNPADRPSCADAHRTLVALSEK